MPSWLVTMRSQSHKEKLPALETSWFIILGQNGIFVKKPTHVDGSTIFSGAELHFIKFFPLKMKII